jgi:hypothetical protein
MSVFPVWPSEGTRCRSLEPLSVADHRHTSKGKSHNFPDRLLASRCSALRFCTQVAEQVGEGGLEGEALPFFETTNAHQPDREQLAELVAQFHLASLADFDLHPFALHALFRKHQQQAVVDLDGPVDLLDEFLTSLHVFRSEPDPQLFAPHLLMQPPSELIVFAAVADEARLVLNRLHRPDERRQVGR